MSIIGGLVLGLGMFELDFDLGMDVAIFLCKAFCGGVMIGIRCWDDSKGATRIEAVVCEEWGYLS
jgi:hypothetical protein